ncbi:hypothetical protein RUND412_007592 [Rhizina undulata]
MVESSCTLPTSFGRGFRDISKYYKGFKATEPVNFMHLASLILLNHRLPLEFYSHWREIVLALEKTRKFELSIEDIHEMEEDMITGVTAYKRLYYQYQRHWLPAYTSQIHGLLHIASAMRICGPTATYHQYHMEREVGLIKPMCKSGSSPNQNPTKRILEQERLKLIPMVAHLPDRMKWPDSQDHLFQIINTHLQFFIHSASSCHRILREYLTSTKGIISIFSIVELLGESKLETLAK